MQRTEAIRHEVRQRDLESCILEQKKDKVSKQYETVSSFAARTVGLNELAGQRRRAVRAGPLRVADAVRAVERAVRRAVLFVGRAVRHLGARGGQEKSDL